MHAGRLGADEQGVGDPAVAAALGHQGQHLELAGGQAERLTLPPRAACRPPACRRRRRDGPGPAPPDPAWPAAPARRGAARRPWSWPRRGPGGAGRRPGRGRPAWPAAPRPPASAAGRGGRTPSQAATAASQALRVEIALDPGVLGLAGGQQGLPRGHLRLVQGGPGPAQQPAGDQPGVGQGVVVVAGGGRARPGHPRPAARWRAACRPAGVRAALQASSLGHRGRGVLQPALPGRHLGLGSKLGTGGTARR